jgi:hypothetical protein
MGESTGSFYSLFFLKIYSENIKEDEDAYARDSANRGDQKRSEIIAKIGFSHPLQNMKEIEDYQEDQSEYGIDHQDHKPFYEVVPDKKNRRYEKYRDQDRAHVRPFTVYLPMIRWLFIFIEGRMNDPIARVSLLNPATSL